MVSLIAGSFAMLSSKHEYGHSGAAPQLIFFCDRVFSGQALNKALFSFDRFLRREKHGLTYSIQLPETNSGCANCAGAPIVSINATGGVGSTPEVPFARMNNKRSRRPVISVAPHLCESLRFTNRPFE